MEKEQILLELQETLFSRKVEFHELTGFIAGSKPYKYNNTKTSDMNIYIASLLGSIIELENIIELLKEFEND